MKGACAAVVLGVLVPAAAWATGDPAGSSRVPFDLAYARVLTESVHDAKVDYARLKDHPESLREAVQGLSTVEKSKIERWPLAEQIAFWINAYNTLTLQVVVSHYPIKSRLVSRFFADPAKLRLDAGHHTLWLSPIFKWFADDFRADVPAGLFPGTSGPLRGGLRFVSLRMAASDRRVLESERVTVRYLDYDWSLNDAR